MISWQVETLPRKFIKGKSNEFFFYIYYNDAAPCTLSCEYLNLNMPLVGNTPDELKMMALLEIRKILEKRIQADKTLLETIDSEKTLVPIHTIYKLLGF